MSYSFYNLIFFAFHSAFLRDRLTSDVGLLFTNKIERNVFIGPNSSQAFCTFRSGGSLFQGSQISLQISCEPDNYTNNVNVEYALIQIASWDDYLNAANFSTLSLSDIRAMYFTDENRKKGDDFYIKSELQTVQCADKTTSFEMVSNESANKSMTLMQEKNEGYKSLLNITRYGLYLLILQISHPESYTGEKNININVRLPECVLLPLYSDFRLTYALWALIWVFVIFILLCWKKELVPRVLLWIGAIILMALIENALFYQEYSTLCKTMQSFTPTIIFLAELFSALKRTHTGMLILNMSLGWSIVEPNPNNVRSHLSRVFIVGIAYFILTAIQSYVWIWGPSDSSYLLVMISILLMSLESFVCCWILYCLAQTKRLLQGQRKFLELSKLYNYFTYGFLVSVVASIIFALRSVDALRAPSSLNDWKELWTNHMVWDYIFFCNFCLLIVISFCFYLESTQKKISHSNIAEVRV
ncbi:transmembrane protein 87A-like [Planococcus citri]|uniref:transmembrane protein 87A-like n=1 Tax=Planococcus citri TaxID=170843 RepID=UPI0031F76E62